MYQVKDESYYKLIRYDLINLISNSKDNKILDVGCGEGETGLELKRVGKASEVVGVEIVEEVANRAKSKLDRVFVGKD